jgi:hypothetical protein
MVFGESSSSSSSLAPPREPRRSTAQVDQTPSLRVWRKHAQLVLDPNNVARVRRLFEKGVHVCQWEEQGIKFLWDYSTE